LTFILFFALFYALIYFVPELFVLSLSDLYPSASQYKQDLLSVLLKLRIFFQDHLCSNVCSKVRDLPREGMRINLARALVQYSTSLLPLEFLNIGTSEYGIRQTKTLQGEEIRKTSVSEIDIRTGLLFQGLELLSSQQSTFPTRFLTPRYTKCPLPPASLLGLWLEAYDGPSGDLSELLPVHAVASPSRMLILPFAGHQI
jgi:hypothetical protein